MPTFKSLRPAAPSCSKPVVALATGLVVLSAAGQPAAALTWDNDYGIDVSYGRDDNFRLAETNELETRSTTLGLFANLEGRSEISSVRITLGADGTDYSASEIDDTEAYRLALRSSRRGERLTASLDLSTELRPTTETELFDTGVIIDGEKETAVVAPGLVYQVDARNALTAGITARDVTYDTVSLTEYTDNSVSVGWRHALTETRGYTVSLRTAEYDPEDDQPTDIDTLALGYDMKTSERTSYTFSLGYSEVDRPSDSETGNDFGIEATHVADERNRFVVSLSNRYEASGTGQVRDEDRLDLQWNRGLSERADLTVAAQAVSNDDRDYAEFSIGGSYRLTRDLGLRASYRYREQESTTIEADSSSVFFSISYSPL